MSMTLQPRRLRPAPEPLGNFIRPGYNDHTVLAQALAERRDVASGIVINPLHAERQYPLVQEANAAGVETILDSKSLELSSLGGYVMSGVPELPWAGTAMHSPLLLQGRGASDMVQSLAETVAEGEFSAVLAPTHFIDSLTSPWWGIDADLTGRLRTLLDQLEMNRTLVYYPLMLRAQMLLDEDFQNQTIRHLRSLPIDGLWLRLHPFGTTKSGPLVLKRYLAICRRLHELGIPLVAEHSGSIGVALLAFGAVGGIESGVTFTDTVNLDGLLRAPRPGSTPFARPPRVYLQQLGAFVEPQVAESLFTKRGMRPAHSCLDASCCPRGVADMIARPREHFLRQRMHEVAEMTSMPSALRPGHYMENFLRPATDRALRVAELEPSLVPIRRRLDSWRGTLGADLEQHSAFTISEPAAGRRLSRTA